jgi:hypothetical protein
LVRSARVTTRKPHREGFDEGPAFLTTPPTPSNPCQAREQPKPVALIAIWRNVSELFGVVCVIRDR